MKFSICNMIFKNWKIDEVFQYAAELGYDAVEIAPFTLAKSVVHISQSERARLRGIAKETNVAVAGLHSLLTSPPGIHINHYDPKVRAETKDYFMELVKCCADIGGSVLVFGSPKQRAVLEQVGYANAWEYAKDTLKECSEYAQKRDVTICLEPLATEGVKPNNFVKTPAEAIKMVEEINNPNFRLILDTFSASAEMVDIPAAIRKYKKYLAHVHVNDDNKRWPGSGGIDWPPIAEALKEIDYQGYISAEVFISEPDVKTVARESINFLKHLFR